jgi:hypothetical protein
MSWQEESDASRPADAHTGDRPTQRAFPSPSFNPTTVRCDVQQPLSGDLDPMTAGGQRGRRRWGLVIRGPGETALRHRLR